MSNPIHINRLKVVSCAVAGRPGLSAYQIAVLNGYTGSEEQWLASLKGDKGDAGAPGVVWYTTAGQVNDRIAKSTLTGVSGATPAVGQQVISADGSGDVYLYIISDIETSYIVVDTANKKSLRGPQGETGANGTNGTNGTNAVIWYTTSAPSSRVLPSAGGVIAAEGLQGPDGAVVAAGQMIVSSSTGKAYWAAGPVYDGAVPLELYEITIATT